MKLKIYTGADINCEELSEIFFFTIEEDTDGKYVHILGNICKNGDGEFMSADFVRLYMSISDFPVTSEAVLSEFMETTSSSVAYLGTMTKEESFVLRNTYFDGKSGQFLPINDITANTPCGKYWFGFIE